MLAEVLQEQRKRGGGQWLRFIRRLTLDLIYQAVYDIYYLIFQYMVFIWGKKNSSSTNLCIFTYKRDSLL